MLKPVLASALALALSAPASAAGLVNLGFEKPIGAEWFVTPDAGRTMSLTNGFVTVMPCSGKWFGYADGGADAGAPASLTQTIAMKEGQTVRGCVGFLAGDSLPFNDTGYFNVDFKDGIVDIFLSDVATVGDFGWSGWIPWSYTATVTGAHTFELGMFNVSDNEAASWTVLDAAIPEPGTWAMMIAGFGLVGFAARRRRIAVAA